MELTTAEEIRELQVQYHENSTNSVVIEVINKIKEKIKTSKESSIHIEIPLDKFVQNKLASLGFKVEECSKISYPYDDYYIVRW